MSNVTLTVGMPTYDWNALYQTALQSGTFNITDNSSQTSLTLTTGSTQLVIQGIDLRADGARHLTAGSITGWIVSSAGQEVARIENFSVPGSFVDLQTVLSELEAPAPNYAAINDALANLLMMEPFTVVGSNDRDVFGTSLVGGDVVNLNGGNDAYIIDAPASAVSVDGGNGRDYMQIGLVLGTGVVLDFGAGQVLNRDTFDVLANFTSFEDGRGSQFDDTIYVSNNAADSFFIEASLGNDDYQLGGDSYARLSYRFFENLTGIAGGIDVNLAFGFVIKPGLGGHDVVWNVDTIQGTNYADTFFGRGWGFDEFEGMDGADSFNGSGGVDRVNYAAELGSGGVFVNLSSASNAGSATGSGTILLAAGAALDTYGNIDTLISIEEITGTDLRDKIVGDDKDNAFWGNGDNDRLYGNGGQDRIFGGDGNDAIYGGDGGDSLFGDAGNDTIYGEAGDDYINGGEGSDIINAGSGNFDFIAGSAGNDSIDGDEGYDMIAFDDFDRQQDANGDGNPGGQDEHAADRINVILQNGVGAGTITGFFGINPDLVTPTKLSLNQTFANVERIRGTEGNDSFVVGSGFSNTEDAYSSFNDPIRRGLGSFGLVGGKGNDTFTDAGATGLAMIDYNEEKYTHLDFDDDNGEWGDNGESGVAVNLSATNQNIAGFGVVAAGRARDTWGDLDTISGITAFQLTETDDVLFAGQNGVAVDARDGDDVFTGGIGADQFRGGRGNDTANGGNGNDNLDGNEGDDVLRGGNGSDQVNGQSGNDTLYGDGGNDSLSGDDGNDILYGGFGRDDLNAGSGNDSLYGEAGNDYLNGDDGQDLLDGGDGDDELYGGFGNDTLLGGRGDDRLNGQEDDDILVGGRGDDRLNGNDGNDTIHGDDVGSIDMAGGNDRINGGQGNDLIFGGYGHDRINGDDGQDTIHGGYGDDRIDGGNGDDIIDGDAGEDDIFGGAGNDVIDGGGGNDTIDGGDDNDTISGGDGEDDLYGGDGDDILEGGGGHDIFGGGLGNDTYVLGGEAEGVDQIWEEGGIDTVTSTITRSIANMGQIENLTLLGNSVADATGNSLDNIITGNDTANVLWGADGNDTLLGLDGADTLFGGAGDDRISGGLRRDVLIGEGGNDIFDFDSIDDAGNFGQRDVITDFSQILGNRDHIDLTGIDANILTGGDDAFVFNATMGAGFSGAGSLTWAQQVAQNRTLIMGDVDGNGTVDFQIELTGLITLTADDFWL
ncbi:MAG: calcium-binding protein [Devosia sp.]